MTGNETITDMLANLVGNEAASLDLARHVLWRAKEIADGAMRDNIVAMLRESYEYEAGRDDDLVLDLMLDLADIWSGPAISGLLTAAFYGYVACGCDMEFGDGLLGAGDWMDAILYRTEYPELPQPPDMYERAWALGVGEGFTLAHLYLFDKERNDGRIEPLVRHRACELAGIEWEVDDDHA